MQIRTMAAAAAAAVALAGAACGEEDEAAEDPGKQSDAPVNTQTPSADPEGSTPAPDDEVDTPDKGN